MQSQRNFVANLRTAMNVKDVSQRELAARAQAGYSQLNRILQLKSVPTLDAADRLAKAIGVPLVHLIDSPANFAEQISAKMSA